MLDTTRTLSISGRLNESDIKRLTREMRGGTVGPTALYYAGVTAPIISAGIALVTKTSLGLVGFNSYWQIMLSAMIAAMAGIVWYLIFMRWSYRHRHGRSEETENDTHIALKDNHLAIRRGLVETRIRYEAIKSIFELRKALMIKFEGADALMIPHRWFTEDSDLATFKQTLSREAKI